jgi:hypothetical protein
MGCPFLLLTPLSALAAASSIDRLPLLGSSGQPRRYREGWGTQSMGEVFNKCSVLQKLGYHFGCHLFLFYINGDVIAHNKWSLTPCRLWDLLPDVNSGVVRLQFYRHELLDYALPDRFWILILVVARRVILTIFVPTATSLTMVIHTLGSLAMMTRLFDLSVASQDLRLEIEMKQKCALHLCIENLGNFHTFK